MFIAGLAGGGWGPLSDSAVIDELEFSQMGRFFYWKPKNSAAFPVPMRTLITHAAQRHVVPATKDIESRARKLRPVQHVTIGGYLATSADPAASPGTRR